MSMNDTDDTIVAADGTGRTDRLTGLVLALIGAGCLVWAALASLSDGPSDGRIVVESEVISAESTFRWNAATKKNELASVPTVEFVDPSSGVRHQVKLDEKLRVSSGDSVTLSLEPGFPRTVRVEREATGLVLLFAVSMGLLLVALGVPMAIPAPRVPVVDLDESDVVESDVHESNVDEPGVRHEDVDERDVP